MRTIIVGAILVAGLAGCFHPSPNLKDFKPSPEVQAKIDDKINKQTAIALDAIIDEKVEKSVAKALPKAVSDGIGSWILDTGPYGLIGILTLLLGKHWVDLRTERKKNGRSEHKNPTASA